MYDWPNSGFQIDRHHRRLSAVLQRVRRSGPASGRGHGAFCVGDDDRGHHHAVLGPILGAIADYRAIKKKMLAALVGIGVVTTLTMGTIGRGEWAYAALAVHDREHRHRVELVFYDSLLPHIAAPEEMDRVSTAGYAVGYLGGGILWSSTCCGFSRRHLRHPDHGDRHQAVARQRGRWWLVFSLPLFRRVPSRSACSKRTRRRTECGTRGVRARVGDLSRAARLRQAFLMLVAFLLYNDGIQTSHPHGAIYGAEIGIDQNAQIEASLSCSSSASRARSSSARSPAASARKRRSFSRSWVYAAISVLAYVMTSAWQFFALAFLVGTVQGGSQALSRSLFARMIPKHKSSEYFGFFSVFEKFAGIAGPAMFAVSVSIFGSSRAPSCRSSSSSSAVALS